MKQKRTKSILCTLLLPAFLLCACTTGEESLLPENKYPMTFTAAVDGLTESRATSDNTWDGGEEVAVQIGGEVKKYAVAADGGLTSTTPFYWQTATETKTVSAWYYGSKYDGNTPSSFTVKTDQSGDGYQQSDFLYAPAIGISFTDNPKRLTFYHQTARVVINVKQGSGNDAIQTNVDLITQVNIKGYLSGTYKLPTSNNTAGTWSSQSNSGSVISRQIATNSDCLKSYAALVIPQNISGQVFIIIKYNGHDFSYTPQTGQANLESGKQYTYTVTLKKNQLEVTVEDNGTSWDDTNSVEINPSERP